MNSLSLASDMMANLGQCHVGDEKTLSVPVRVTAYGAKGAEFEVIEPPEVEEFETNGSVVNNGNFAGMAPAVGAMLAKRKAAYA